MPRLFAKNYMDPCDDMEVHFEGFAKAFTKETTKHAFAIRNLAGDSHWPDYNKLMNICWNLFKGLR